MDQDKSPLEDTAKWQVLFKELDRIGREITDLRNLLSHVKDAGSKLQADLSGLMIRLEYLGRDMAVFRQFQEEGVKIHGLVGVLKSDFDDLAVQVATTIEKEATRTWDIKKIIVQGLVVLVLAAISTLLILGFQAWLIRPHP